MVLIPFDCNTVSGYEKAENLKKYLHETLGEQWVHCDTTLSKSRLQWRVIQWGNRLEVHADEETELLVTLKYGGKIRT